MGSYKLAVVQNSKAPDSPDSGVDLPGFGICTGKVLFSRLGPSNVLRPLLTASNGLGSFLGAEGLGPTEGKGLELMETLPSNLCSNLCHSM